MNGVQDKAQNKERNTLKISEVIINKINNMVQIKNE